MPYALYRGVLWMTSLPLAQSAERHACSDLNVVDGNPESHARCALYGALCMTLRALAKSARRHACSDVVVIAGTPRVMQNALYWALFA